MRIDLHTHSNVSDGTQTPAELVRAAKRAALDVVALTDHDTRAGWDEAAETAREVGITLVRGMEISTKHEGRSVHLLAYLPDPEYPPLVEELRLILEGRDERVPRIVAKLNELGHAVTVEEVRRGAAEAAATGRPHVADVLVRRKIVADRDEAFARFLSPGMPAYVSRHAAPLERMVEVVAAAGGVTVVAHPWGRHGPGAMTEETLGRLRGLGLAGVEVDHQDHDDDARERLRAVARDLDLVATGSSDHHGLGKSNHPLGCNTTTPEEYARLLERAASAAAASGRETPEVVQPA